jgi:hypothetical protein
LGGDLGGGDAGPGPGITAGPTVNLIPVKLVNPTATNFTLSYSLNGQSFSLPAGSSQTYDVPADAVIEFGRGENLGVATYGLRPGTYTFQSTPNGWDLFQGDQPPAPVVAVTIVNPADTQTTLNFSIDGTLYHVDAGKAQTINVGMDSTIEFGRGENLGIASYGLRPGIYTFKDTANGWDLDPSEKLIARSASAPATK